ELEDHGAAAQAFAAAAEAAPEAADWLRVLHVEQLAKAGDPRATTVATRLTGGTPPARMRRVLMEADAWVTAAETQKAIRRLDWEARVLNATGARNEAARLHLRRAELLLGSTEPAEGRRLLVLVARDAGAPADARREAAARL